MKTRLWKYKNYMHACMAKITVWYRCMSKSLFKDIKFFVVWIQIIVVRLQIKIASFYLIVHTQTGEHHHFNKKSEEQMEEALVTVKDAVENLMTGDIFIGHLNLLIMQKQTLLELCRILLCQDESILSALPEHGKKDANKCHVVANVLQWREQEIDQFWLTRSLLTNFLAMCNDIQPGKHCLLVNLWLIELDTYNFVQANYLDMVNASFRYCSWLLSPPSPKGRSGTIVFVSVKCLFVHVFIRLFICLTHPGFWTLILESNHIGACLLAY